MSLTIKCDVNRCESISNNVTTPYNAGKGWHNIQMNHHSFMGPKHFSICPACSEMLGLNGLKANMDPAQKLLDIIYEIVQEVVDDNR